MWGMTDWYALNRERVLARSREKRAALKAAGGADWEQLLKKWRAEKKRYRGIGGRRSYDRVNRKSFPFKTWLCARARRRGRQRGLEATIMPADLVWPTHCPVLGIELDYPVRSGERKDQAAAPNWPSLDRWDSTKGYVPGNVFVISYRANTLKNNATLGELLKIAEYLRAPPSVR